MEWDLRGLFSTENETKPPLNHQDFHFPPGDLQLSHLHTHLVPYSCLLPALSTSEILEKGIHLAGVFFDGKIKYHRQGRQGPGRALINANPLIQG